MTAVDVVPNRLRYSCHVVLGMLCLIGLGVPTRALAAPGEVYALLVGINDYQHATKLQSCVNDVQQFQRLLVSKFGFPDDKTHIRCLLDSQATHKGIDREFHEQLVDNARAHPNALCVFYFSGHGSQTEDANGDEALINPRANLDETLVTVRASHDGIELPNDPSPDYDIIDDDIAIWLSELGAYTSHVLVVLDCCHSGTAFRGDTQDEIRTVPPDTRKQAPQMNIAMWKKKVSFRSEQRSSWGGNGHLVVLTACGDDELARSTSFGLVHEGIFTNGLTRELRRCKSNTTYHQLMERVGISVNDMNCYQHPQVGGDGLGQPVLGGRATTDGLYASVVDVREPLGTVILNEGLVDGLAKGTLIALYAPRTAEPRAETGLEAIATVTDPSLDTAIADAHGHHILKGSIGVVISHGTESQRVRVALPLHADSDRARQLVEAIRNGIGKNNGLLELSVAPNDYDIAVKTATFKEAFAGETAKQFFARSFGDTPLPKPSDTVFYCTARGAHPLYGFFTRVNEPLETQASDIVDLLEKFARQKNVRSVTNDASVLSSQIIVRLQQVGKSGKTLLPVRHPYQIAQGDAFDLQITNRSTRDVYVYFIDISSDGKMHLYSPIDPLAENPKPEVVAAGKTVSYMDHYYLTTAGLRMDPPVGTETIKVLASTQYRDLSFLNQSGVLTRGPETSLFEELFAEANGNPLPEGRLGDRSRDVGSANIGLGDWTTVQVDCHITGSTPSTQQ